MMRFSKQDSEYRIFSFRPRPTAKVISVRWGRNDPISIFDAPVAKALLINGAARVITQDEMEAWNKMVDDLELGNVDEAEPVVMISDIDGNAEAPKTPESPKEAVAVPEATTTPASPSDAAEGPEIGAEGVAKPTSAPEATEPPKEGNEEPSEEPEENDKEEESSEEASSAEEEKPKSKKKAKGSIL